MILSILLYTLGFASAGLAAAALAPFVTRRAARLTRRRFEASLPTSLKDVQADRDDLRAELAVSARRLELEMEKLKERDSALRVEVGEKVAVIDDLGLEIKDRDEHIIELTDVTEKQGERIEALEEDLATTNEALEETREQVVNLNQTIEGRDTRIIELSGLNDAQRVEIAALRTQTDNQEAIISERSEKIERLADAFAQEKDAHQRASDRIVRLEHDMTTRGDSLHAASAQITRMRNDHEQVVERLKTDLSARISEVRDLQQRVTMQAAEAVRQTKRSQTLEAKLSESASDIARLESRIKATQRIAPPSLEMPNEHSIVPDTVPALKAELGRQRALIAQREVAIAELTDNIRTADRKTNSLSDALRKAKSDSDRLRIAASSNKGADASSPDIKTLTDALAHKSRLVKETQERLAAERRDKQHMIAELRDESRNQRRRIEMLERQLTLTPSTSTPSSDQRPAATPHANTRRVASQRAEIAALKRSLAASRNAATNDQNRTFASIEKLQAELAPTKGRVVHLAPVSQKPAADTGGTADKTADSADELALKVDGLAKNLVSMARNQDGAGAKIKRLPPVTANPSDRISAGPRAPSAAAMASSRDQGSLLDRIKGLREHG